MTVGPVQLVVFGFEGDVFKSGVLDELGQAAAAGDIRLIDFLVVEKDEDGSIWGSEVSVKTDGEEDEIGYGTLAFAMVDQPFAENGGGAAEIPEAWAVAETNFGLAPGEINELVHKLPEGSSAIVVLFEHTWAKEIRAEVLKAGGLMLAQGMVNPAGMVELQSELGAVIETASAIEAEALLEAEAAVEISEAIKGEAAKEAVEALAAAELVEEAALEEAARVVAASLIVEEAAVEEAQELVSEAKAVEQAAMIKAVRAMIAAEVIEEEAAQEAVAALVTAELIEEAAAEQAVDALNA